MKWLKKSKKMERKKGGKKSENEKRQNKCNIVVSVLRRGERESKRSLSLRMMGAIMSLKRLIFSDSVILASSVCQVFWVCAVPVITEVNTLASQACFTRQ